jgi:hypothetical protein
LPPRDAARQGEPRATEEFTDANIAALLDEANKADSAAGAVAVEEGVQSRGEEVCP